MEYLFYYMAPTPKRSGRINTKKTQEILVKTQVFFVKTERRHLKLQLLVKHFILFLLIFFSEIVSPKKNQ